MRLRRAIAGVGGVLVFVASVGCSGGDSNGPAASSRLDEVTPYVVVCIETTCEAQERRCKADQEERCDSCFDACVRSVDPAGCASTCRSVCSGTCTCYGKDECAVRGVEFVPPPRNEQIYSRALELLQTCAPGTQPPTVFDWWARYRRHEFVDYLECMIANHCSDGNDCASLLPPPTTSGTVGSAICQRQQACGKACNSAQELNDLAPSLRPAMIDQLNRCANEANCEIATACWEALGSALNGS